MTDIERNADGTPLNLKDACNQVIEMMPLNNGDWTDVSDDAIGQKRMDIIWFLAITQEARRRGAAGQYNKLSEMLADIEKMVTNGWRPK